MERLRKPFQGILNIIRFNWHFYLLSIAIILLILLLNNLLNNPYHFFGNIICVLITATTLISLFVSFYVYDLSNLYSLNWLDGLSIQNNNSIVNINAGFDETSILLTHKFPQAEFIIYDFYDPLKHTEVSIKRARKAYPAFPGTKQIITASLPLPDYFADTIFILLAAHEIRNEEERDIFFKELKRILKPSGKIIVTEHLRDIPNFLAYNIGFFHFFYKSTWLNTFKKTGLLVSEEIKITPFISTFILKNHGASS